MKEDTGDVILKTVCRTVFPFIELFGLYVLCHGHNSAGGGFQGGCIMASGFILLALSYGLSEAERMVREGRIRLLLAAGVLLYSLTGAASYLFGKNFLDYSCFEVLGLGKREARYFGIFLVEVGVLITVFASMFSIFRDLTRGGRDGDS